MIHSENQYKMLEEQSKKLKKEIELKYKENKLLRLQNKQKDELIHDLDKYNYYGQCQSLKLENNELKKIKDVRRKIRDCQNQFRKK